MQVGFFFFSMWVFGRKCCLFSFWPELECWGFFSLHTSRSGHASFFRSFRQWVERLRGFTSSYLSCHIMGLFFKIKSLAAQLGLGPVCMCVWICMYNMNLSYLTMSLPPALRLLGMVLFLFSSLGSFFREFQVKLVDQLVDYHLLGLHVRYQ